MPRLVKTAQRFEALSKILELLQNMGKRHGINKAEQWLDQDC